MSLSFPSVHVEIHNLKPIPFAPMLRQQRNANHCIPILWLHRPNEAAQPDELARRFLFHDAG